MARNLPQSLGARGRGVRERAGATGRRGRRGPRWPGSNRSRGSEGPGARKTARNLPQRARGAWCSGRGAVVSTLLAFAAACLFGIGTYLVLQRKLSRIIIGLGLLSHGPTCCCSSGRGGVEPLVGAAVRPTWPIPSPRDGAHTIVITFGVSALLLAMAFRSWILTNDDEVENDIADTTVARGGVESRDVSDEERAEREAATPRSAPPGPARTSR